MCDFIIFIIFQGQVQVIIATDGQSVSSSWCRAPFGAGDQMLHFFE
jgi:hypothetical protein